MGGLGGGLSDDERARLESTCGASMERVTIDLASTGLPMVA